MNGMEEISKKKAYYEGLKKAIEAPLPKEAISDVEEILQDDETEESYKETMRLWKEVVGPLGNAIVFIHNNRFIVEEKEYIISNDSEAAFKKPQEIFGTLRKLLNATVMEFLSVLQIPSGEKTKLLECIEKDDKDSFVSMIESSQCDMTALAKLCSNCMDDASGGAEMKDGDLAYYLDYLVSYLHEGSCADDENMLDAVKRFQPSVEVLGDDDSDESLERYISDYRHFLETSLATYLHYYWDWHDDFTLKERNLIEPILDNPLAEDLVEAIWKEYEASRKEEPEEEPIAIPSDFFSPNNLSNRKQEHFFPKDEVAAKGIEAFSAFINYLVEKGYIANNNNVKALFAYRLTGRCRPEEEDLPVVEWHGKNNKPYELIYIIRSFSERGDYKKMKLFFQGPEWVADKDSSYADSADSEFRRFMAGLYPEICKFKK